MKRKFDLRIKVNIGETWMLEAIGAYAATRAIYRYDGKNWRRELAHKNCQIVYSEFLNLMEPKEFKELFEKCDTQDLGYLLLSYS